MTNSRRAGGEAAETSTGARVPVLVVSGFLGSGKTTLVRRLLADAQRDGLKVAVVSNEFGDLGIDKALLGPLGDGYVELEGGCICCRLSDELVETLQNIRERVGPDRIIVETSGLALPFDVQINFWREPVSEWAGEDLAVVMVNAEQLYQQRDLDTTFSQQVSSADLLVLNQIDRVPESAWPQLEAALREIEPDAPLVRARHGDVDPLLLFPPTPRGNRRVRDSAHAHDHHHDQFIAEEIEVEPGLSENALGERLAAEGVLRIKGFVETDAGVRVVQGVGGRIEFSHPDAEPPAELIGRLVVIRRA